MERKKIHLKIHVLTFYIFLNSHFFPYNLFCFLFSFLAEHTVFKYIKCVPFEFIISKTRLKILV